MKIEQSDLVHVVVETDEKGAGLFHIFGHPVEDLADPRIIDGPKPGKISVGDALAASHADAAVVVKGAKPNSRLVIEMTLPAPREIVLKDVPEDADV